MERYFWLLLKGHFYEQLTIKIDRREGDKRQQRREEHGNFSYTYMYLITGRKRVLTHYAKDRFKKGFQGETSCKCSGKKMAAREKGQTE